MYDLYVKIHDAVCPDPLAAKEAIAAALEHLGGVTVVEVRVAKASQMELGGMNRTERR